MGIPSYYRKLIQKYSGIVKSSPPKDASILCYDFNCLIYRCIRAPGMPSPPPAGEACTRRETPMSSPDSTDLDTWEGALLKEVRRTTKEVWDAAGRPKKVFIAVDGVVPMAKIRQQRVRRFKSAWLRRTVGGASGWDSNAITPGTQFMEKLTAELKSLVKEQRGWELSSVDEPGEGEHKIMQWIRAQREQKSVKGTVMVYGLDADLILLSMLTSAETGIPMALFREKQEFGGQMAVSPDGVQEYSTFDLGEFQKKIGVNGVEELKTYVTLMSLMGNDFLPHSLTHSLKDDGHDCIMDAFRGLKHNGISLLKDDRVQQDVLKGILAGWSREEDSRFQAMIRKKREQAGRGVGKGMDPSEALPLEWNVEKEFVAPMGNGALVEGWRELYWRWIHPSPTEAVKEQVCKEYIRGMQWVLDYYLGKPVDRSWMFPAWIPPLWSDFGRVGDVEVEICGGDPKIQPREQLAMVLPLESWGLIRGELKALPSRLPQMWPAEFGFFSLGRKWLWECEARIPVLTVERVRAMQE
jgi:5'-3' exonuclease